MHKYRHAARRDAWDPYDNGKPNYNPFAMRHWPHRMRNGDEEDPALHPALTVASESQVTPSMERRRIASNMGNYNGGPPHANTMPPFSETPSSKSPVDPPASSVKDMAIGHEHDSEKGVSQDSSPPVSDKTETGFESASSGDSKPRRRKYLLFGPRKDSEEVALQKKEAKRAKNREGRSKSWLKRDKQTFTAVGQFKATILNSYINILLVFVPIGIAVNYAGIAPVGVFVINFIAIIPLAAMLSYATEEIALRTGETIGGLLNATFGNAVELIVSILALVKNEVDIVQESLIGSILSNLLLVMGMCFFFGGINRVEQHFNVTVAQTASSLLALAVGSLIIPAAFQAWADGSQQLKSARITELSRGTAILLLVVYGAYLFFQLKTHASMYSEPSPKVEKRRRKVDEGDSVRSIAAIGAQGVATMANPIGTGATQESSGYQVPEEETEEPKLSKWVALFTLAASTALVAICAEFMVNSINAITASGSVSRTFVGLILLPIVGNAAEHATAVTVACKDKMDLAIGVAVGSSMQIALLVIPFTVVLGWILGNDDMNLAFDGFQIAVLFVAVLLVNYLIQDGKSHWLEGVLLQILYMIIAIAAWFYPPDNPATINSR